MGLASKERTILYTILSLKTFRILFFPFPALGTLTSVDEKGKGAAPTVFLLSWNPIDE